MRRRAARQRRLHRQGVVLPFDARGRLAPRGVRLRPLQRQDLARTPTRAAATTAFGRRARSSRRRLSVFPQFMPERDARSSSTRPSSSSSAGLEPADALAVRERQLAVSDHFSFDLGVRLDKNQAHGWRRREWSANKVHCRARGWRLIWDPTGDGRWARQRQLRALRDGADEQSSRRRRRRPATRRPTCGSTRGRPSMRSDGAARRRRDARCEQVFDWFDANGGTNRRAVSVRVRAGLQHDDARAAEVADTRSNTPVGIEPPARARAARCAWTACFATYHDFYSQRADLSTGSVTDAAAIASICFFVENTNDVQRRYSRPVDAGQLSRRRSVIDVGGNYTLSRAWGNFDGETVNGPERRVKSMRYPEYKTRRVELAGGRSRDRPASSRAGVGDLCGRRCRSAPDR